EPNANNQEQQSNQQQGTHKIFLKRTRASWPPAMNARAIGLVFFAEHAPQNGLFNHDDQQQRDQKEDRRVSKQHPRAEEEHEDNGHGSLTSTSRCIGLFLAFRASAS